MAEKRVADNPELSEDELERLTEILLKKIKEEILIEDERSDKS